MSEHKVVLNWRRQNSDFAYETFDRAHTVQFPGGQTIQGSSAPQYLGNSELANPEEMLAAALASCHMLTFLAICARSRLVVDSYEDLAVAELGKNEDGRLTVTRITLHPKIVFGGDDKPDWARIGTLHEKAHANCFIGLALKCEVSVERMQA